MIIHLHKSLTYCRCCNFQAASLLKKTEGLVTLVVCNPNKAREEDRVSLGTLETRGSTPNRSPTPTPKEPEKTSEYLLAHLFFYILEQL